MPRLEKFSENALTASSSRNRTLEGEGSEDEEAPERRGFRDEEALYFFMITYTLDWK